MTGVASAIAGAAVVGAGAAVYSSKQQSKAASNAQNIAVQQQQQNQALEQPYNQYGQAAMPELQYLEGIGQQTGMGGVGLPGGVNAADGGYGSLNQPFTTSTFQQMSPAYQFTRQQGGQGVINQDAGTSGALSGAAMKDLLSFNSGLANQSFNNAFEQYQTQNTNIFNRLNSMVGTGQAAASGQAQVNTSLAGTAGQAAQNIGTAQAGGTVGVANALGGGATNAAIWNAYGGGAPSGVTGGYAADIYGGSTDETLNSIYSLPPPVP